MDIFKSSLLIKLLLSAVISVMVSCRAWWPRTWHCSNVWEVHSWWNSWHWEENEVSIVVVIATHQSLVYLW